MDSRDGDGAVVVSDTLLVDGVVRVVFGKRDATVVEDIPHAVVLPATAATVGIFVAVNALLLRKLQKLSTLHKVLSFHRGDG